jgi:hypothetical protein
MSKHCGTCPEFASNQHLTGLLSQTTRERDEARAEATDWKRRYTELEETIGSISAEPVNG